MNLLLFLSALLTSFTGAISGQGRAGTPAVQQSAAQALEVVIETAIQIPALAPLGISQFQLSARSECAQKAGWAAKSFIFPRDVGQVFEKLLV